MRRWLSRRGPVPPQPHRWACGHCGSLGATTADADAAMAALREHWATCPRRKVRVTGKGGIWAWKHPGCESAWSAKWEWEDAFRGGWWHARSHDESLRGGERTQYANAARSPRGFMR